MDKNITEFNVIIGKHPQAQKTQTGGHLGAWRPESPFRLYQGFLPKSQFPLRGNNMPNDYIAVLFNYNALKVCTLYFSKFFPLR